MFAKKVPFAIVVFAIALVGCASRSGSKFNPAPGGPIIVIQTEPDGLPTATAACTKPPCWYIDCPDGYSANGLPAPASDPETLIGGIPWRLGDPIGAEKIVVTLKAADVNFSVNPIDASAIELQFGSKGTLMVRLPAVNTRPSWTLKKGTGNEKKLTRRWLVYLPTWPHDLFEELTSVSVEERKKPNKLIPVKLADIESIKIFYNRDDSDVLCE